MAGKGHRKVLFWWVESVRGREHNRLVAAKVIDPRDAVWRLVIHGKREGVTTERGNKRRLRQQIVFLGFLFITAALPADVRHGNEIRRGVSQARGRTVLL